MSVSRFSAKAISTLGAAFACLVLAGCQMERQPSRTDMTVIQQRTENALIATECAASNCRDLDLTGKSLNAYTSLTDMTHLRTLMISYTSFSDLSTLQNLTELQDLHISRTSITDVSALTNFPKLTLLHAQEIDVDDWSVLSQLTQLEELALGSARLTSADFVQAMPNLKVLDLSDSPDLDITGLANHPSLEMLELTNLPTGLEALLTIPNLKAISVSFFRETFNGTTAEYEQRKAEFDAIVTQLETKGIQVETIQIVVIC